jgi:hypothetical protein
MLVFAPLLVIFSKLFQVSQTSLDVYRPDGEYLLSSSPLLNQVTHLSFIVISPPNFVDMLEGSIGGF